MKMKAVPFWVILFLTLLFTACSTEKTDDEENLSEDELKRMFANTNGFEQGSNENIFGEVF